MAEQTSIPKHKISRAAALGKAGLKIGVNYTKHYGKKVFTGVDDREALHQSNAEDSYEVLSQLKGGPLKVAQMLSIDKNLLPSAYAEQFSQAQYSAPPLSYPLVAKTFRRELGQNPLEIFDTFTRKAVSGASIGQVHKATKSGRAYAVKVQYPGVAESLQSDLRLVKPLALRMFELKAAEVEPYFKEVEERLLEETDYELELRRGNELIAACTDLQGVRFPKYYPEFSSGKVLTMDWMDGITLDKFCDQCADEALRNQVGQALWDFYHHQVHELRVFHADPHPGNFLVSEGKLVVLDFGCVKALQDAFYRDMFVLLDSRCLQDRALFQKKLERLELILPQDSEADRTLLLDMYQESTELLGRPFREEVFNFGDPAYMRDIYDFGEKNRVNKDLKRLNTARGSADALYVNRAYFGLYSLMARLGARVKVQLPQWLQNEAVSA